MGGLVTKPKGGAPLLLFDGVVCQTLPLLDRSSSCSSGGVDNAFYPTARRIKLEAARVARHKESAESTFEL
jgi:hypothetical protein